jgi:hypothetical protein
VEGIPAIVWGILAIFALPARPELVAEAGTPLFPNQGERESVLEREIDGTPVLPNRQAGLTGPGRSSRPAWPGLPVYGLLVYHLPD